MIASTYASLLKSGLATERVQAHSVLHLALKHDDALGECIRSARAQSQSLA